MKCRRSGASRPNKFRVQKPAGKVVEQETNRYLGYSSFTRKDIGNTEVSKIEYLYSKILGLIAYFRKFIPTYVIIAKPLSNLRRKENTFEFNENQKNFFLN